MKDLRNRFREETKYLHDILENQYPFNQLSSKEDIELNGKNALICFKVMFYSFLKVKKSENSFYQESFDILSAFMPSMNNSFIDLDISESYMELEYLFLGSRMGNKVLTKRNPSILKIGGGKYFGLELPNELWRDFLSRLSSIKDEDYQNFLLEKSKKSFLELINYGRLIELKAL